jgi:hypothetical protein
VIAAASKKKMKSKRRNISRFVSIFLVVVLIGNLVFFALGKIKDILFWAIILVSWVISRLLQKYFKD